MRTFKLQVQTSVDGYMAGPNGEMDRMPLPWSDDVNGCVDALTESVDCIVLGRRLAEGFVPHWAAGPEGEDRASIDWMNGTPKRSRRCRAGLPRLRRLGVASPRQAGAAWPVGRRGGNRVHGGSRVHRLRLVPWLLLTGE